MLFFEKPVMDTYNSLDCFIIWYVQKFGSCEVFFQAPLWGWNLQAKCSPTWVFLMTNQIMSKKWNRNERSGQSFLSIFLPCSILKYSGIFCMFICPDMVKWDTSGTMRAFCFLWWLTHGSTVFISLMLFILYSFPQKWGKRVNEINMSWL